jgi:hypothetical protein
MTSTRRPGLRWAITALRRAIGTLRYVNDELTRANEALFRPVGAPRGGRPGSAARPPVPAQAGSGGDARQPEPTKAGAGGGVGRAA